MTDPQTPPPTATPQQSQLSEAQLTKLLDVNWEQHASRVAGELAGTNSWTRIAHGEARRDAHSLKLQGL